jgi:hypothetical protein
MAEPLDLFDIVPGMCGPYFESDVVHRMLDGLSEVQDIRRAGLDVISNVTGRPWWFSMRLIKTVMVSWEIVGGELAMRGIDAQRMSIAAWLDAVYYICIKNIEHSKLQMFMSQLEVPPPEELPFIEDSAEMEMSTDEFLALGN